MKLGHQSHHFTDHDGNPAGGHSFGTGFAIAWQNGPLGRGSERKEPNGAFVEDVLDAVIRRIEFYEDSAFACQENKDALVHLRAAADGLDARTKSRKSRGVEGTHKM